MSTGNDSAFENLVEEFSQVEKDENKNIDNVVEEEVVEESYGDVYIAADIKKGLTKEQIIKKIQDRYPDITDAQAEKIYAAVESGEGGGWPVDELPESVEEEVVDEKKLKDISDEKLRQFKKDLMGMTEWSRAEDLYLAVDKEIDRRFLDRERKD